MTGQSDPSQPTENLDHLFTREVIEDLDRISAGIKAGAKLGSEHGRYDRIGAEHAV